MLTKIRDKATGWIAYTIVIFISIPFALWGIQQYFGLDSSPTAITVDDQEISEFQLEQAIRNKKQELEQAQINLQFSEDEIKTEVIGEIVSEQLLNLAVEKYNLQITDTELAEFIRNQEEFKTSQRFDSNLYKDLLTRSGYSITEFEHLQRDALKGKQFINLVQDSSFILPGERKRYIRLIDQKRKIRYLPIDYSYYIEPDSISDEQARAYYNLNTRLYVSPYKIKLDYLEIDINKLEAEQTVDDEEAREYYDNRADDYLYPEKFNLRHILISTDDQDLDIATAEADDLYRQLIDGSDFADIAREHSDDDLTAASGGELPELTADELDNDEVREAILQLAEGEFTTPIRTQYGIQIFQLIQLSEAEQKPFDEVRTELIEDIKYQKARSRYAALMENLDLLLFENEAGFFSMIQETYGYRKRSTGFLDINKQESILADPKIRASVISEIIEEGNTNSGLIEVEAGKRFYFVGVVDTRPSVQLSFEDAKQDVITNLIIEQAHLKTQETSALWIKELEEGTTNLEAIATENELTIENPDYIKRSETSIPRPIVEKTFAILPTGKIPLYKELQLDDNYNNNHIVIELLDIEDGKETSQTVSIYSLRNREGVAILDSLRDFHEVEINVETEENEETTEVVNDDIESENEDTAENDTNTASESENNETETNENE